MWSSSSITNEKSSFKPLSAMVRNGPGLCLCFSSDNTHNSISTILKKYETLLECDLQILEIKDSMGFLHMGIHNNILELSWTFHLIS